MTHASMPCFEGKSGRTPEPSSTVDSHDGCRRRARADTTLAAAALALALGFAAVPASAHKASDAYLQLDGTADAASLRVDVALRDLDLALDLDTDGDARLTWREVQDAWPAIERYLGAHAQVEGCTLRPAGRALERRADGVYAALTWSGTCAGAVSAPPAIRYSALADVDPTHRGIARIAWNGHPGVPSVLDPTTAGGGRGAGGASPGVSASPEPMQTEAPASFLAEGIHHILGGYDHVLFLLCLLLPSVMRRGGGPGVAGTGWQPVGSLRQALWPVVGIVTAFTLAHSITLALAALKWVSLPPSFIEPAIAVTIVLAALDNLRPIFRGRRAVVTFLFGLIHGFGFAGVLAELNLSAARFAWALLQFNLGLELGQLMIVVGATALLYAVRGLPRYPAWVIRGGSLAAMLLGVLWFIERTADVSLLPL